VAYFLLKRVISLLPVLLVVMMVDFLIIHLIPGDPASVMAGPNATTSDIEQLRSRLNLDLPLHVQFGRWAGRALRGDLGESLFLGRTVNRAVWERAEPTLLLTVYGLLVAVVIGMPLGILAAVRPNTGLDRGFMFLAVLGVAIPTFWLGLIFIYAFAVNLRWLPAAGYASLSEGFVANLRYLTLPALSLGLNQSALVARMTRSFMLEVLREDYIRTARSKGLAENLVILRHAMRNVLVPTVTVVGLIFAVLLGGAVTTEIVFNIPGAGRLLIDSVLRRDYPVIQGAVLYIALAFVIINLIVDMLYVVIDPRIKYA
jgi:peptide/nickel transport system permease protein